MTDKEKQELYNEGISIFGEGILIYQNNKKQQIIYSNESLWKIYDCYTEEEFMDYVHESFLYMVLESDLKSTLHSIENQIASNKNFDYVKYRIRTKNGQIKYVYDFGHYFYHEKFGDCYFVHIRALTFDYEPLTGLSSTTYFIDKCDKLLNSLFGINSLPAMISFNLNGMKMFNTKFGMKEGDQLLIDFAKILTSVFGQENCSRFGEDHFYVVSSSYQIRDKIDRVFKMLKRANNGRTLSCRAGVYIYEKEDPVSASVACDRARIASDSGTPTADSKAYRFNHNLKEILSTKDYVLNNLDEALKKGYIKAYFQPQVITNLIRMYGFEALARWLPPNKTMLNPDQFIPVLEEFGLTYKLDLYIIEQACIAIRTMIDRGSPTVPVSINLSRTDFIAIDPVEEVTRIVDKYRLPHDRLRVEITESTIISNPDVIRKQINRFRKLGFLVLMDDFGSKYSSLEILRDFEFDEVKIDMGFMRSFTERSKNILRSMVTMAKSLGIHTLCEGVETKEQVQFLRAIGCEFIQGYYFGKPLPFNEAVALAKNITKDYYEFVSEQKEAKLKHPAYEPTEGDKIGFTHSVIGALSSIFNSVYLLDLRNDTYEEIKSSYALKQFLGKTGKTSANFPTVMHTFSHPDYIQMMLRFTDSTTLKERLAKEELLVTEFLNTINGWCKCAFFVMERDALGNAVKVLNTVRVIDKEKNDEIGMKTLLFSLSNFYFCLINLNLFNQLITPMILPSKYRDALGMSAQPYELAKRAFIDNDVNDDYRPLVNNFLELLTMETRLSNSSYLSLDYTNKNKKWRRIIIAPSYIDNTGKLVEAKVIIEDIDEARTKEFMLQYQADHDALTGLRNRGSYDRYIAQLKERDHPLAFLFLDIDRFKMVNDTYGHEVGDIVLKELANNIRQEFIPLGNANRLGGDEFTIIINNFVEKDAHILTEKINNINSRMSHPKDPSIPKVTISCGISFSNCGYSQELVRQADISLYHVKKNGGGSSCVYSNDLVDIPIEMLKHRA